MTRRLQVRAEQRRIEDAHDLEQHRQRQAAAALNAETKKLGIENQRDAKLRAHRERRCAMELMCQGLRCSSASWEEDSTTLMSLLDGEGHWESWLGQHTSARPARKQYLSLTRRWHPDKWVRQGDACVAIATEETKSLVQAYEQAMRALPTGSAETGDDDDEREVCSRVGLGSASMACLTCGESGRVLSSRPVQQTCDRLRFSPRRFVRDVPRTQRLSARTVMPFA